jgi:hypothetical protein
MARSVFIGVALCVCTLCCLADVVDATETGVAAPAQCASDEDCSLNGVCTSGTCLCDAGWTTLLDGLNNTATPGCGYLDFLPSPISACGPACECAVLRPLANVAPRRLVWQVLIDQHIQPPPCPSLVLRLPTLHALACGHLPMTQCHAYSRLSHTMSQHVVQLHGCTVTRIERIYQ